MATLTVNKIKSRTAAGKWFTAEIVDITIYKGKIYFTPKNKTYQHLKLCADNCIIIS